MVQTDSWMNMKHLQSIPNFDHNKELVPVSVLLLYRRDDAETSLRAAQLRKQLQSEYSDRIKVIITVLLLFSRMFWYFSDQILFANTLFIFVFVYTDYLVRFIWYFIWYMVFFRFLTMAMKLNGKILLLKDPIGCHGALTVLQLVNSALE